MIKLKETTTICLRIIIFSCFLCIASSYANLAKVDNSIKSDFDIVIEHIQSSVGCSRNSAESIFLLINYFAEGIQESFVYLATSKDELSVKNEKVKYTINKYFESRYSLVQVGVRNYSSIFEFAVHTYLRNLCRKNRYKYTKVELEFNPDYLGIGSFEKTGENTYELSISMWMIFRGIIGDEVKYEDATRKKFRLNFFIQGDKVQLTINEIIVAEIIDLNYYKRIIKNKGD